jgi:hypothetical protein
MSIELMCVTGTIARNDSKIPSWSQVRRELHARSWKPLHIAKRMKHTHSAAVCALCNLTRVPFRVHASIQEHTDNHWMGSWWAAPRAFTAIVYAHNGWQPGHGGELTVYNCEYEPQMAMYGRAGEGSAAPVVVEPRGGTLALFPAHCIHSVAPVEGCERYCVTMWLSLQERVPSHDSSLGRLASELSSTEWVAVISRTEQTAGMPPPGTIMGNKVLDKKTRAAGLETLKRKADPGDDACAWRTSPKSN